MIIEKLRNTPIFNIIEDDNISGVDKEVIIRSQLNSSQIEMTGLDVKSELRNVIINEAEQFTIRSVVNKLKNTISVDDYTVVKNERVTSSLNFLLDRILNEYHENSEYKFMITNGNLASSLQDVGTYYINPIGNRMSSSTLYPMGIINGIHMFVDAYMRWDDNRIIMGNEKINVIINPNIEYEGFEEAERLIDNALKESQKLNLEEDPFGEENWNIKMPILDNGEIFVKYFIDFNFDETKFKQLNIIDNDKILI